jgi:hypothetical protein
MILLKVTITELDHECKINSVVIQFYIPCNQLCGVHHVGNNTFTGEIHSRIEDK